MGGCGPKDEAKAEEGATAIRAGDDTPAAPPAALAVCCWPGRDEALLGCCGCCAALTKCAMTAS